MTEPSAKKKENPTKSIKTLNTIGSVLDMLGGVIAGPEYAQVGKPLHDIASHKQAEMERQGLFEFFGGQPDLAPIAQMGQQVSEQGGVFGLLNRNAATGVNAFEQAGGNVTPQGMDLISSLNPGPNNIAAEEFSDPIAAPTVDPVSDYLTKGRQKVARLSLLNPKMAAQMSQQLDSFEMANLKTAKTPAELQKEKLEMEKLESQVPGNALYDQAQADKAEVASTKANAIADRISGKLSDKQIIEISGYKTVRNGASRLNAMVTKPDFLKNILTTDRLGQRVLQESHPDFVLFKREFASFINARLTAQGGKALTPIEIDMYTRSLATAGDKPGYLKSALTNIAADAREEELNRVSTLYKGGGASAAVKIVPVKQLKVYDWVTAQINRDPNSVRNNPEVRRAMSILGIAKDGVYGDYPDPEAFRTPEGSLKQ